MAVGVALILVLVASGGLTAMLTVAGWRNLDVVGADWFVATMGMTTVWLGTAVLDLLVRVGIVQIATEMVITVGAITVPVLWFSFVVEYTGRGDLLDWRGVAVLWAIPTTALGGLLAAPVSDLYFAELRYVPRSNGVGFEASPGPLAWVNLCYAAFLFAAGLWLITRMLWDHDRLYSGQALGLIVGTLAPVAMVGPAVFELLPPETPAIALGFSVLGVAYGVSLFKHRFLDLSPASRRVGVSEAFDDLGEGVVVVDVDDDVVAINERACRLFECQKGAVLGAPVADVEPSLATLESDVGTADVRHGGRVMAVSRSAVRDTRDRPTGAAFVARDVTADRRRKQRLDVLNRVFRHNIRNTMNAVVGPADVLAERTEGTNADAARTVYDAGQEVVELSEFVRDIESMMTRPVEPSATTVRPIISDTLASVDADEAGLPMVDVPAELTVQTDGRTLSLVVKNVVENALEHGTTATSANRADGGRSERAPSSGQVRIAAESCADGCLVHVSDEGPGIPQEELEVLRAGHETQLVHGSGLGLWAIHWGITRLGGAVRFDTDGIGTRVTLWVPDCTVTEETTVVPPRPLPDHVGSTGEWFGSTATDSNDVAP